MEYAKKTDRKRSFDPVVDDRTRLLIVGSLPGDLSLRAGQYYANPQNAFWRLLSHVLQTDLQSLEYGERLAELLRHGIGLWDVIADAKRRGSLDANIVDQQPNNIVSFLYQYKNVHSIACNGRTAVKLGLRQLSGLRNGPRVIELASSSPAHAIPFEEKCKSWLQLRAHL